MQVPTAYLTRLRCLLQPRGQRVLDLAQRRPVLVRGRLARLLAHVVPVADRVRLGLDLGGRAHAPHVRARGPRGRVRAQNVGDVLWNEGF